MQKITSNKGITLTYLIITLIVLSILTGTILISTDGATKLKRITNMYNDLEILEEQVNIYYNENNKLPTSKRIAEDFIILLGDKRNSNDDNNYYLIDINLLADINLNYGKGKTELDYYVVNAQSHTVYYLQGVNLNGVIHYRLPEGYTNINKVDKNAPDSFSMTIESTIDSITIKGTPTSNIEIKGYEYRINGGEWTTTQTENTYIFPDLDEGETYTVSMRVIDKEGNITYASNNGMRVQLKYQTKADGSYDEIAKVNTPDTSKLPEETTKYVKWNNNNEQITETIPENWYNYERGEWANIKSTANELEAYWVWIPRFAYKLPESSTAKEIEVIFIKGTGKTGVLADGTEVECYYTTDTAITTDGSGLYSKKAAGAEEKWIIHPAFWWDNDSDGVMDVGEQLAGIWVGKYESSSSTPTATDGGGNVTNLQVQIKPNVSSWRSIQVANMFTVCENIKKVGGVIGNNSNEIDTHMMKNMEWGAVAILSQSKYGVFNPQSKNGGQVWNNSNNTSKTGQAGSSAEVLKESTTSPYNSGNGPKASTTGTVYGIYDMAGGNHEYVMGLMATKTNDEEPAVGRESTHTTGFTGKLYDGTAYTGVRILPSKKYYDLYKYESYDNLNIGKIGDATSELKPSTTTKTWNKDKVNFIFNGPVFTRGGMWGANVANGAGIFAYEITSGNYNAGGYTSFRAVVLSL